MFGANKKQKAERITFRFLFVLFYFLVTVSIALFDAPKPFSPLF
ncbi:hypothetical protein HD_0925 [[Haemophilus] ducreyi 35000HP]|uniref:Uncharacterized protein n=1 Tax=Haemophilus ducreyi (strain 35000HP / ATCC 700724) TaxID=233412 RepID=Q7VMP8_HAEDU|nr:hypothetical protein HD_0925 [[Haemophilus] ducreyi 35000HP]